MRLVPRLGGGLLFAAPFAIATLVVVACAKGTDSTDVGEGGAVEEDAARDVNVVPIPKDSSLPDDSGPLPGDDSGTCTRKVVINELQTRNASSASHEFIELYNPSSCAVPLGNWKIPYKSNTGGGNAVLFTFANGDSIAAGAYLLLATSTFSGAKDKTFPAGMADDGQIALLDENGKAMDAVGYGTTATGPYLEGSAAASPTATQSIARKMNGVDTNDNKTDFKTATPSPGQPN
jgi:hypothetical protein